MDVKLLKIGDKKAFQALIDATYPDVFRLAMKFTADVDDSKDIVQEVYIETYKNIKTFREDANIKTWLYRITINKALNFLKKK